jgi:hypothetical protein
MVMPVLNPLSFIGRKALVGIWSKFEGSKAEFGGSWEWACDIANWQAP